MEGNGVVPLPAAAVDAPRRRGLRHVDADAPAEARGPEVIDRTPPHTAPAVSRATAAEDVAEGRAELWGVSAGETGLPVPDPPPRLDNDHSPLEEFMRNGAAAASPQGTDSGHR